MEVVNEGVRIVLRHVSRFNVMDVAKFRIFAATDMDMLILVRQGEVSRVL